MRPRTSRFLKRITPLLLLALLIPLSVTSSQAADGARLSPEAARHLSSGVASRHYLLHPQEAPEEVRPGYEAAARAIEQAGTAGGSAPDVAPLGDAVRFNRDALGLPQNEESVSACGSRPDVVLGGTNDYRGLVNPRANFTGWHLSTNGGKSVVNEGLLPTVSVFGKQVPSGGDPVDVATYDCQYLYAASLNYDPVDPFGKPSAIGVYRTTPERLAACAGGDAPACWPVRRAVAQTKQRGHFLDKEWMTVGRSGDAGRVVWVTYTDFHDTPTATVPFTAAIYAVRCTDDLNRCTRPIKISGNDRDVQFSDVTIDARGRTYITWSEIQGELEGTPQTFVHKLRVAEPGSTTFGPTRVVYRETRAIPFGGKLHANDFRIATVPKNTVKIVQGKPRVFVTWDACRVRVLDFVCEDAEVKIAYSDDSGRNWSRPQVVSAGGENYFPTISKDPDDAAVTLAYFTNRFDPLFHNRQDVELLRIASGSARVTERTRVTPVSNESEADPVLGGSFIGDYIEVAVAGDRTYVHYNANYVPVRLLGTGEPIPQQDNFMVRTPS